MNHPDSVGINFDHFDIINPKNFWALERYQGYLEERYKGYDNIPLVAKTLIERGEAEDFLLQAKAKENNKIGSFEKYLEGFENNISHARVHPEGEESPLTPSQAIEINLDRSWNVSIAPEFVDQIKTLQKHCPDITLVVQFYDHRRSTESASDVPQTPEQIEQYTALCDETINQFGENIQLEIGNETNISRKTDKNKFGELVQHASHVDASEYAHFYFEVATAVKEKHPGVRLSIAGVACYDPIYIEEVLSEIARLQKDHNSSLNLVDTISFHPYRNTIEGGSVEVRNGAFKSSPLTYTQQLENMQQLANSYGVSLNVGEINFDFNDEQQMEKLEMANSLTAEKGVTSFIYPGIHVNQ